MSVITLHGKIIRKITPNGKMITKRFYKDEEGWFIDLPEWPGSKYELAMVMGADEMLDILAVGKSELIIQFSNQNFENAQVLRKFRDDSDIGGAHYTWTPPPTRRLLQLWLCDVTKFLFGSMPEEIYFKVVKKNEGD
jgi:hypothetical protein